MIVCVVRALSARIDELSSDTKPRRASAAAQGPLVHLTMDELNEIISRAVSNQVAAVTSKMKSDVDAAVGASLQTLQVLNFE